MTNCPECHGRAETVTRSEGVYRFECLDCRYVWREYTGPVRRIRA